MICNLKRLLIVLAGGLAVLAVMLPVGVSRADEAADPAADNARLSALLESGQYGTAATATNQLRRRNPEAFAQLVRVVGRGRSRSNNPAIPGAVGAPLLGGCPR